MESYHIKQLEPLAKKGWSIAYSSTPSEIPHEVRNRYPWIHNSIWHLISRVETVMDPDEHCCLLTWKNFSPTPEVHYPWNIWEQETLKTAAKSSDEEWRSEIIAFWDEHFPIMFTVQPFGYGYAAIRKSDGAVVAGWAPDFETPFGVIAESFDDLLGLLPEMDPGRNIDSLLPDDD